MKTGLRLVSVVMLITLTAAARVSVAQERGLYVTRADAAARDESQARWLIDLVRRARFSHVVLYHLAPLLNDGKGIDRLAALLAKLRAAGVRSIGAPVASPERVETIVSLGNRVPGARFDFLVTEFEYWNRCDQKAWDTRAKGIRAACFAEMQALVQAMRSAADREEAAGRTLRLGAYLGSPTEAEVRWLSERLDLVFLDFAIQSPDEAWQSESPRGRYLLRRIAMSGAAGLQVWPILYVRGEVPMKSFLRAHGLKNAESSFMSRMEQDPGLAQWRSSIAGFQYFADDAFDPFIRP